MLLVAWDCIEYHLCGWCSCMGVFESCLLHRFVQVPLFAGVCGCVSSVLCATLSSADGCMLVAACNEMVEEACGPVCLQAHSWLSNTVLDCSGVC